MKQQTISFWVRKLTSRKFWLTVAGLIGTLIASIGFGDSVAARITSVITAGGLIIAYVFGESMTDASAAGTTGEETQGMSAEQRSETAPDTLGGRIQ